MDLALSYCYGCVVDPALSNCCGGEVDPHCPIAVEVRWI